MSGITYDVEATSAILDRMQERTITDLQAAHRFWKGLGMRFVIQTDPAEQVIYLAARDYDKVETGRGFRRWEVLPSPEGVILCGYGNFLFLGKYTLEGTQIEAMVYSQVAHGPTDRIEKAEQILGDD